MFLDKLNEKEKDIFIELAVCISQADGIISDEEKKMFEEFGKEMRKTIDIDFSKPVEIDAVLSKCTDVSDESKKIICFEILGLAVCDDLDETEKVLIDKMTTAFGISSKVEENMEEIITELFKVYRKINILFTH